MRITVLFFASYAEALGRTDQRVDLPSGATVADLVESLRSDRLPPNPLVAVNERYARPETTLKDGDEVALIPPVAGG